jgi:hypothetical protein
MSRHPHQNKMYPLAAMGLLLFLQTVLMLGTRSVGQWRSMEHTGGNRLVLWDYQVVSA